MNISKEDVDGLSSEQKRALLCSDPITTARHFSQRFQKFIAFMKGSSKPIGEIVHYFWRVEFQLRGSPHVHSLWWVKDAPDLQTVEGLRAVPGFIDKYITTEIPSEGEDDKLCTLVLRLQRHKHTHTHARKMADVGVGLIIPSSLVLRPVLKQMQTVEIRLGFIL